MTICFTCPGCGASHIASPKDAGKLVDCKRCGLRQNVPNFPLQPTILGEVRRPNFPHGTSKANTLESEILPQENNDSHHSPSNLSQGEKLKNPDASEQTGDFVSLTARRSRSKTRQLIFLIIGGLVFFGIGIIVLFMIVNRAAELQSPSMAKQDPKLEQKTNNLTPAKIHATTQTSTKSLRKSDPDSQNPTPDTDQSSASSNFLGAVLALSFTLIIALTMIVPNLIFLWRRRANSKDSGFFRKKENQSGDSGTDHSDKKKRTLRSPNQNHTTPPASKNCRQPKRQLSKHGLIPNAVTLEDLLKYLFWLGIYSLLCGIIAVIIGYRPFEAVWLVPDSNSNSERLVYSEILSDAIQRDSVQVVKWGPHGYLNNDPSYELIRVVYYSKDSSDNKVRSDVFYSIKDGKIQFRGNNPWGDSWIKKTRPIPAPDQS